MHRAYTALVALNMLASFAAAEEIGFKFSGMVVQPSPVLGQGSFAFGTPLSGRFVYETTSLATHDPGDGDSAGYRQKVYNGLSMTIGGVAFRADDYVVAVFNNDPMNQGADVLSILYSSALDPPPTKPLAAGGAPYTTGVLNLTLKNSSGAVFSDSSLPANLQSSAFGSKFGFLRDSPINPSNECIVLISAFQRLAAVAGDYDFDADVDGSDFLIWQRSLGSTAALAADGNHNDAIEAGDLSTWRTRFGDGGQSIAQIPEPSTVVLSIITGLLMLAQFRSGKGRRQPIA